MSLLPLFSQDSAFPVSFRRADEVYVQIVQTHQGWTAVKKASGEKLLQRRRPGQSASPPASPPPASAPQATPPRDGRSSGMDVVAEVVDEEEDEDYVPPSPCGVCPRLQFDTPDVAAIPC